MLLLDFFFLLFISVVSMKGCINVFLMYISLIINEIEHFKYVYEPFMSPFNEICAHNFYLFLKLGCSLKLNKLVTLILCW